VYSGADDTPEGETILLSTKLNKVPERVSKGFKSYHVRGGGRYGTMTLQLRRAQGLAGYGAGS